ncbi:MAG: efflux RND transporter periplasmic adaptor subunit [Wenzhouxiangella sp.]
MNEFSQFIDRSASLLARHRRLLAVGFGCFALILAVAIVAFAVGARNGNTTLPPPDSARAVRVAPVQLDNGGQRLRLPGVTRAAERSELAFLHGGQLAERRVRRGQYVSAGQVLAILHNPALMPGLSAAEAGVREIEEQLGQVEREVRRLEDLHQRNLVPTEELERIVSRRNALKQALSRAEAERNEAREQLAEAQLRAPYAGTVVELFAEPGQFVSAGEPVISLAGHGALEVVVHLGAERASHLQPDQEVTIRSINGRQAGATIGEIGLAAPGRPASIVMVLDQPDEHWQPGQGVQVELVWPGQDTLTVPLAAIIDPAANNSRLFRIVGDRALMVPVKLGSLSGDRIAIEGPLTEGDLVVVAGQGQLLDDEPVRVLR